MPTLTNAHTHLELNWATDCCPPITGRAFPSWLANLVERRLSLEDKWQHVFEVAVEDGILELLSAGTTHVGDVTTTGVSIPPLLASGLQGIVYVEMFGQDPAQADDHLNAARAVVEQWRPKERNGMTIGLSLHAPYSTHPVLWEKTLDYARREALPLCIHIAESPEELEYMTRGTGDLIEDYFHELDVPLTPAPLTTPIKFLEDVGALDLHPLLVHAVHVTGEDIARIAAHECSVVHCPRSNLRLRCGRMPLDAYLKTGVRVYLGTDSRGSSPSLDVRTELDVAAALHFGKVEPEAIARMARTALPYVPEDEDDE